MRKKYNFSINFGLSSAFAFVVIITSICISVIFFLNMRTVMRQDLNKRIHDILAIGITKLDSSAHASLTRPEQEDSPVYRQIKKTLQEIRDGSTQVRFVYTIRQVKGQDYQFIVDAEENSEDLSHLGDPLPDTDIDSLIEKDSNFYISKKFETDQWGTWLTGYTRIITPEGRHDGYLCLDISAKSIIDKERSVLLNILVIDLLITILFILLGIGIARGIAKPLSLLEQDMIRIKDFNLDAHVDIRSRFIEIMNMKYAEDNMKTGLQSFKKYVPAALVSQLITLNKEAKIGGEKKQLSILFSDIADFTTVSESLSPEKLSEYMAEYFEGMTSIIIRHQGTVDKYIGDAIMAFWGAPLDLEDHAWHTCMAALECRDFLATMNESFKKAGKPVLHTRFGINSGEVIVGNFGYQDRFNYTVIGDNVNLASRLEAINKLYKTTIIISEATHSLIAGRIACRKIDIVAVKGKKVGIPIYEVIAPQEKLSPIQNTFLEDFRQGMDAYLARDWNRAIQYMDNALKTIPEDYPSTLIIRRCREFLENPPEKDWQGVIVLREK